MDIDTIHHCSLDFRLRCHYKARSGSVSKLVKNFFFNLINSIWQQPLDDKATVFIKHIFKKDASTVVTQVLENRSFSLMLKIKHIVKSEIHWHINTCLT